jgi:hypothetical protein
MSTVTAAGDGDGWVADTRVRREGCALADLYDAVTVAIRRWPGARVVRNPVGNLCIHVDGQCVAEIDLTFGRIHGLAGGDQ